MEYLLIGLSAFLGAGLAIVGYTSYLNFKKTQAMLGLYSELKKSIEDEMTFIEIAENLSKEMENYDD
jgi:hypothetical protein